MVFDAGSCRPLRHVWWYVKYHPVSVLAANTVDGRVDGRRAVPPFGWTIRGHLKAAGLRHPVVVVRRPGVRVGVLSVGASRLVVTAHAAYDMVGKPLLAGAGMAYYHPVQILAAHPAAVPLGCAVGRRHDMVQQAGQEASPAVRHLGGPGYLVSPICRMLGVTIPLTGSGIVVQYRKNMQPA